MKWLTPNPVIKDHMIGDGAGSGWGLIRHLRGDPQTTTLPILLCTGAVHRVRPRLAQLDRLGVVVVFKPFDIDDLLAALDRFGLNGAAKPLQRDAFAAVG